MSKANGAIYIDQSGAQYRSLYCGGNGPRKLSECTGQSTIVSGGACYEADNLKVNVNPNGKSKLSWNPVPGATSYSVGVGYTEKLVCSTTKTSYETVLDAGDYSLYMVAWNGDKIIMTSDLVSVSVPLTLKVDVNPSGKSKLSWNPVLGATSYSVGVGYTEKLVCSTTKTSYETVLDVGDYSLYMAAWNGDKLIMTSALVPVSVPLTLKVDVNPNGKSKLSWNPVPGATSYSVGVGYTEKLVCSTTKTSYETVLDVGAYSLYMAAWNGDKLIMTSNLVPVSNPLTLKVDVNPNGKSKLSWNPVPEATSYSIAIGYVGTMVCSTTETSYETVLAAGEYSLYLAVWNGDELIMTSALVPVSVPFTLVNEKLDPISLGNEKIEKGDINGDEIVNAKDLNMLYAHINGTKKLNEEQLWQADVTGEGEVTAKDLNRLYAHVNGTKPL